MSTATKTGFELKCPGCGEDGSIVIDLNNLGLVTCGDCNEEFDPSEVASELVASARKWAAVARWLDMVPAAVAGG